MFGPSNGWSAIVALVALIAAAVFLVLWLVARSARRRQSNERSESEWTRIDRELELAEQAGRMRIIRELQDVAIQSVGRLVTQAQGIRYAAESDPAAAARSTAALESHARDALADMRRVQSVVREGEAVSVPQPSLHSARDLFRVMREAGLQVTFAETGERFELRPGAELAVFRILQGTLENALKHGGAGTDVRVGFGWTGDGLQVTVDDDGIRAAARQGRARRRAGLRSDPVHDRRRPAGAHGVDLRRRYQRDAGARRAVRRHPHCAYGARCRILRVGRVPRAAVSQRRPRSEPVPLTRLVEHRKKHLKLTI